MLVAIKKGLQVIRSHLLPFYSEVQKFIKLFRFHSTILIHTRKPVADHLLAFKENIFETVVFFYYKAAQRVAQCKNLPIFFYQNWMINSLNLARSYIGNTEFTDPL